MAMVFYMVQKPVEHIESVFMFAKRASNMFSGEKRSVNNQCLEYELK